MKKHKSLNKLSCLLVIVMLALTIGQTLGQDLLNPVNQPVHILQLDAEINGLDLNSDHVSAVATTNGVYLLDATLLQLMHVHKGEDIRSVSWKHDSSQLAIAFSNLIEIWNWDSSINHMELATTLTASGFVTNMSWSPDGEYLAALGAERGGIEFVEKFNIWDTSSWTLRVLPKFYSSAPGFLSPLKLTWNINNPQIIVFYGYGMYLEDDEWYFDEGSRGNIYFINAVTGETVQILDADPHVVSGGYVQPGGSMIALPTDIGTVRLYDLASGAEINSYSRADANIARITSWTADGTLLLLDDAVINVVNDYILGKFHTESGILGGEWFNQDEYPGQLILAERAGRITIQDIFLLPNPPTPTGTYIPPTEAPVPGE
jgi:WD40 repeat protein